MLNDELWVESFVVGALAMRCSVITDLKTGDTIIIDGGAETDRIISWIDKFAGVGPDWSKGPSSFEQMKELGLVKRKVVALVNTHAHFDHSGEIPYLKERYEVSWYLHEDDFYLQSMVQKSAQRWGFSIPEPAVADEILEDNTVVSFGSITTKIYHTPGHSLGSCCIEIEIDDGPNHLFAGDTLFAGSVGRTDLPNSGGDFELLYDSITNKLWPLSDETVVHPGHGPQTTIGIEKESNPFVGLNNPRFNN